MKQVLYFYMASCKGCKTFDKVFDDIVGYNLDGYEFEKVNVLECFEFCKGLNVTTTPSFILYNDDKEVDRKSFGMNRDDFLKFIFQ